MPPNRLAPATLADLMREVGIQPSGHSLYTDSIRRPIPRTDAYVPMRDVQLSQRQEHQSFSQLSQRQRIQSDIGRREAYDSGIDPNTGMTQAQEALLYNLEPTGVPSLFRSYNSFQEGRPLEGAGHGALGLLGTLGTASMASTPARQAATQTARLPLTGALEPPTRLPVNPTRDIAPNGLPIRPSEPFRASLNGGSDDLLAAARQRPEAGASRGESALNLEPGRTRHVQSGPAAISYDVLNNGDVEIRLLQTDAAARGQGAARAAMQDFLARPELQGRRISLVAEPQTRSTDAAQLTQFYRSLGFEPIGSRGDMALRIPARPSSGAEQMPRSAALEGEIVSPGRDIVSPAGRFAARLQPLTDDVSDLLAQNRALLGDYQPPPGQIIDVDALDSGRQAFARFALQDPNGALPPASGVPRLPDGGAQGALEEPLGSNHWRMSNPDRSGFIEYHAGNKSWRIGQSVIAPEMRGQGRGVQLYEQLIERARSGGARELRSDQRVTPEAQRVWDALERRGYAITRDRSPAGPTYRLDLTQSATEAPTASPGPKPTDQRIGGALGGRPTGNPAPWDEGIFSRGPQSGMPRRNEPFWDDRLSPSENKVVEMRRNGFFNAEIADEMGTSADVVRVLANRASQRGVEVPPAPRPTAGQGGYWDRVPLDDLVKMRADLRANGRTSDVINIIAQRTGLSPSTVKTRLWRYDQGPKPTDQKNQTPRKRGFSMLPRRM